MLKMAEWEGGIRMKYFGRMFLGRLKGQTNFFFSDFLAFRLAVYVVRTGIYANV